MTPATVRQAAVNDIDDLALLFDEYRRFYGQPSNPVAARVFLRERLDRKQSVLFIARDSGSAAGFVQLYPSFSSVSLRRIFILNDLFVAPAHRRRGIGGLLLDEAADYAREVGALRMTLSTASDNAPAQALYESKGWTRDDRFWVYNLPLEE